MDTLTQLRTFLAVVRNRGFSEAARDLNVVPSVVGKRIAQLEHTTRARLFDRDTRKVEPTPAGRRLEARAAALVCELDALLRDTRLGDDTLAGRIRVMAPTTLATQRLAPIFAMFLQQHPQVTLEVSLSDRSINPAEVDVDIAISGRPAHYDGVVDVPLAPVQPRLCASPDYLARAGTPAHPRDLAAHHTLAFGPAGRSWIFHVDDTTLQVDVRARLIADDNHTLLVAARAGLGLAVLPAYVCEPALADGSLERVLPSYALDDHGFKAYVPARRQRLPRVRALLEALSRGLAAGHGQPAP